MGAKPSSVSKPGKYQPQNGSGVESNNPSSSLEPPRVSSYIFEESPAYPESPLIHTLVVTGLEVITEGQEHNGGTSQPDTTTATQPPSPSWSPPLPQPLNQSASTPYEPAPVALDPIRNVSPSGTYLPLSLLLERTGRSWPNHIRVASGQPAWNIPDTGPMPPELLDMRAEMARQATRYIADDAASPAEAPHGISYELDITPPISRSTPRFPGLGFNATGPASPLGSNSNLIPPVSNIPMDTPGLGPRDRIASGSPILGPQSPDISTQGPADTNHASEIIQPSYYDTTKPTCSLNLVCYRSGSRGCDLQQIHCVLRSMYSSEESFQSAVASQPHLVYSDDQFFREMKRLYTRKMCGLFRRYFSLKTLRAFRILSYTPTTRPTVVPFDDFILQEMMYAYRNPERLSGSHDWIKWVFRLRRKDKRHALEFVEGWSSTRIAITGTAPWLSSCLVGIIWTAMGGDAQTAFTVASFILTSSSIVLALLAVISSIESSGGLAGMTG